MNVINVVMECYNEYEDAWATPILVTSNRDKAEAKLVEMNGRLAARNSARQTIIDHMKIWEDANPRPSHKEAKLKSLPDYGRSRHKWSPEQLAEYKAVKQSNQEAQVAAIQPIRDWSLARFAEETAFKTTLPEQVRNDYDHFHDRCYWEIEEVPWEE